MSGPVGMDDAERKAKGNPGHRRSRPRGQVPQLADLESGQRLGDHPPSQLSARQKTIWKAIAPAAEHLNLLQRPDVPAFARYVQWLDRFANLERATRDSAEVEVTSSEHVTMTRLSKSFHAMTIIDKRLQDYEDRFGLNPRERQGILLKLALNAGAGAGSGIPHQGGLGQTRGGEAGEGGQPTGGAGRAAGSAIGTLQRPARTH